MVLEQIDLRFLAKKWILLIFVSALALITISCRGRAPLPRLEVPTDVLVVGLLDSESGAQVALPSSLQEEVGVELKKRGLRPIWRGPEAAGPLRSTAARWEATLEAAKEKEAPFALLVEARARPETLLEGRFRWTVSTAMALGPSDRPAARSDLGIEVPVFLRFRHEGAEAALDEARGPIGRRLRRLVGEVLEGAGLPMTDELDAAGRGKTSSRSPLSGPLYFVLVDRFEDGDSSNNGDADPQDPEAFHGGDLAGLMERLPWLDELGVEGLWLSPITLSGEERVGKTGPYHGYWVEDHRLMDPRFGSFSDLEALKRAAEARGMDVLLDWVANHVGYSASLRSERPQWFHQRGPIQNWSDPQELEEGDVHGLPDLRQEDEEVYGYLRDAAVHWVERGKPDGFRLDAVKHVPLAFWRRYSDELREHAGQDFTLIGEIYDGAPRVLAEGLSQGGFSHVFDFPFYYAVTEAICDDGPASAVAAVFSADGLYPDFQQLVTFVDNHDTPRLATACKGEEDRIRLALALLLVSRGVPCLTYGTEVGLSGEDAPENRQDMRFDASSQLFPFLKELINLRTSSAALGRGRTALLHADDDELVFLRQAEGSWALVAMNRGTESVDRLLSGVALPGMVSAPRWGLRGVEGENGALRLGEEAGLQLNLPPKSLSVWTGEGKAQPYAGQNGPLISYRVEVEVPSDFANAEQLLLVGSLPALGAWEVGGGLALERGQDGVFRGHAKLPFLSQLNFKLVRRAQGGVELWEGGPNRSLFVGSSGASEGQQRSLRLVWGQRG